MNFRQSFTKCFIEIQSVLTANSIKSDNKLDTNVLSYSFYFLKHNLVDFMKFRLFSYDFDTLLFCEDDKDLKCLN